MELDENGKERRNALLVSAALFSAAYLQLGLPSFLAAYIKLEIPPENLFKVWILAAILAIYVLMRYHYSASRTQACLAEKANFAEAWLLIHKNSMHLNECVVQAHKELSSALGNFDHRKNTTHFLSLNQIKPTDIGVSSPEPGYWVQWQLSDLFKSSHKDALSSFSPVTFTRLKAVPSVKFHFLRCFRQVVWSAKAWEVNTTYLLCIGAAAACVRRAAAGADGWLNLLRSFF